MVRDDTISVRRGSFGRAGRISQAEAVAIARRTLVWAWLTRTGRVFTFEDNFAIFRRWVSHLLFVICPGYGRISGRAAARSHINRRLL
jgi:hypothetical protein